MRGLENLPIRTCSRCGPYAGQRCPVCGELAGNGAVAATPPKPVSDTQDRPKAPPRARQPGQPSKARLIKGGEVVGDGRVSFRAKMNAAITGGDSRPVHGLVGDSIRED